MTAATEPNIPHPVLRPAAPPSVRCHGLTHPGRVRESNEDHYLVAELVRTLWVHQSNLTQPDTMHGRNRGHLFLVADGMGGHRAGEVASALSVTAIEEYVLHILRRFTHLQASDEQKVLREFQEALQQADDRLIAAAAHHPEFAGMGTTLTLAFVTGWRLFVAHAGDSRCYLFRGGKLGQLTEDHTIAAELARRGVIEPEEVENSPFRHMVTNVLGGGKLGVRADVGQTELAPGDALLLCSDGLTDMLEESRIATVLAQESDPHGACARLVAEANDAGGQDNVTAVVAQFEGV